MVRPNTLVSSKDPSSCTVEDQLRDIFGEEQIPEESGSDIDLERQETHPIATGSERRKQANPVRRKGNINALRELRKLFSRTDNMIPRLPFSRLIKELLIKYSQEADRISFEALCAIQEASEAYVTQLFQDSYACTVHRGRVTLTVKDMELVRFLRGGST